MLLYSFFFIKIAWNYGLKQFFRRKKLNKSAHIVISTIVEKLTPTFTPPHVWIKSICSNTSRRLLIQKAIWKFARKMEKKWLWTKFLKGTSYILKGLFLGVSIFFNRYLILLIWLRRFRIFFQNPSSVIRSRASILLIIGGEFHSQKRETGTKRN